MQRTIIILLAVALVATGAFLAVTIADKKNLEAELAAAPPPPPVVELVPEPTQPAPEPEPEPAEPEPPTVASTEPVEPATPGEGTGTPAANSGNPLAAMMENPVMLDMMKQQMSAQFKSLYGGFFEKYGVGDELAQPVYDLLLERQMAAMKNVGVLFDKDAPEAEKEAARKKVTDEMDSYNDQIKELLGEEAFEEFDLYEKSTGERMELSSLKGAMESAGHDFSVEKEEKLMAIMYEERQNFDFTNNFADQTKVFEQDFSKENFSRFTDEYVVLQEKINTRVAEVLSPEEHAVFTKNQQDYRNMIKAGIEMQANIFGGGE